MSYCRCARVKCSMDQARDAQSVHPSTSTLKVNNRLRLPFAAWVGSWSRVDLPLLQPPREGVVISLDFMQKKRRISYYSLHVLDCLDTTCAMPSPPLARRCCCLAQV